MANVYEFTEEDIYRRYNEFNKLQDKFEKVFDNFVNGEMLTFFGVCGNQFKLNKKVFEAVENPDDGYRSHLGFIAVVDTDSIFFKYPLGVVKVVKVENFNQEGFYNFEGYIIRDVFTRHIWLIVGTDNSDDYYPCFTFRYTPDLNQKISYEEDEENEEP
jgi:hypothetical protein